MSSPSCSHQQNHVLQFVALDEPKVTQPGKRLQKTIWKITMLLMGKSIISMAIFNSELVV
jgi:hypothetical protein